MMGKSDQKVRMKNVGKIETSEEKYRHVATHMYTVTHKETNTKKKTKRKNNTQLRKVLFDSVRKKKKDNPKL